MGDPTPKNPDLKGRVAPYILIQQLGVEKNIEIVFPSIAKWEKARDVLLSFLKTHHEFFDLLLDNR